ncbi:hypothetical protein NLJ89_g113 [Agrocybe chaxingu]|uniref:SHSP domain-containing protein n=1 Tax=Agrocybe chaxingu TaxID=84603 RepID=A0A9W8N2J4_9AGAR|nr:hypothetical protein NLJ89_g113 [Agrocybe chaxingu]
MSSVFFYEPFYDFDCFFDNVFAPHQAVRDSNQVAQWSVDGVVRSLKPRMDLHEDKEKNVVTTTFEFLGVSKNNINIDVHNNHLTVSAEMKQSTEHEENRYAVHEHCFGKFSHTLQLPQGVKDQEIKASMENRVLTMTFPKIMPELAPKRITIS